MKLNRFIYIFIVFLIGCEGSDKNYKTVNTELEEIIKYYENGNIKSKGYKLNGLHHGQYWEYYENGEVKFEAYYKNGKQDSIQKAYYSNGKLMQSSYFENDLIEGEVQNYNEQGRLISKQEYVIVNDSSVINQVINYDENGEIDQDKSNYFILKAERDTIESGEEYNLNIKLEVSIMNFLMSVQIGDYDEQFNIVDSSDIETLHGDGDFEVNYSTNKYQIGVNILRGIIYDYVNIKETDSDSVITKFHPLYFEKTFYVLNDSASE